jgi:hypothetical protein
MWGKGRTVIILTMLQTGRSGVQILAGVRDLSFSKTSFGADPASYLGGTGVFLGVKGPGS